MTGISQRAYARLRGVTLRAVQKAISTKRITTLPDGSIDPERANQEWAKNTFAGQTLNQARPQSRPSAPAPMAVPGEPTPVDPVTAYLRARAIKENFAARIAQFDFEERQNKLMPTSKAGEFAATISAIVRDHIMAQADRLAPVLVGQEDERVVHRIISEDGAALLRKLSKGIANAGF